MLQPDVTDVDVWGPKIKKLAWSWKRRRWQQSCFCVVSPWCVSPFPFQFHLPSRSRRRNISRGHLRARVDGWCHGRGAAVLLRSLLARCYLLFLVYHQLSVDCHETTQQAGLNKAAEIVVRQTPPTVD